MKKTITILALLVSFTLTLITSSCQTINNIPSNRCVYYDTIMNVNINSEGKQEVIIDYVKHYYDNCN